MAVEQKNFSLFTYVSDDGHSYNMRGEKDAVRQAVDGSTAPGGNASWGRTTSRHSPRKITYVDLTTQRTKTVVFYTAAAWNAITLGTSTLSFQIEGETVAVVYTASKRIPERQPKTTAGGNLPEHA